VYVKRHRVHKGGRDYVYLRLVEAYRNEAGQVRQRLVHTLGREDELKASGQLDQLAASFARLDPPPTGTRRDVGPLLVVAHYLGRLGLVDLVDEVLPVRGRALLTNGEVVAALVANRLCGPAPLYDVASWASSAALAELFGVPAGLLNDDRLGRALEALAPKAEELRAKLLLQAIKRCKLDASPLHLDLTAVRFAGSYKASALVKKGWSAERTTKRQVKALQASTRSGVPVYFRPHQGAESELAAFMGAVEALARSLPPGLVVVAGSGLGYLEDLCSLGSAGVGFVVPLRAGTGWAERFVKDVPGGLGALRRLGYCSQREQRLPKAGRTVWKGLLRPFPVTDGHGERHGFHVAYIWSSEEEASVKDARKRALQKAEAALSRVHNGLGGRYYKTKKQVDDRVAVVLSENVAGLITVETGEADGKPTISWSRNDEAVAKAGELDGLYALATNLPARGHRRFSALEVLKIYKDQWAVEQRHRDLKQTLRVRPVFLHNDARIEGLVAVVGIALLIFGLVEAELRAALGEGEPLPGILPEGRAAKPTARAALTAFDGLQVTYTKNGLVLDHLSQLQRLILALLDIPIPWPEKAED
jgi:transposase